MDTAEFWRNGQLIGRLPPRPLHAEGKRTTTTVEVTVEIWRNGQLIGWLPKDNRDAAIRTAWLYNHTPDMHAIVVAPRTERERTT